ncbi:MAG TPA: molybdenum cofactor guanylyltransferase [Thermoanaerobaculia bacterium]|nr:molybdenum cofactor guanylyltransferase [Thermoanaerobaculia bacterium]
MAYGFVLVGGLSRRMGRDKALLPLGGVPMALLQARKLERICGRAAFVGKEPAPLAALGFPFVHDQSTERAALHGLLASLEWSPEELTIVLAADVPRVPETLLAELLARLEATGAPAVVPTAAGHPQPLCAAWSRAALPALRLAVAAGDLSLRRVVEATHALVLSEEETTLLPGFAGGAFRNVNTPEEYRAAEEEIA